MTSNRQEIYLKNSEHQEQIEKRGAVKVTFRCAEEDKLKLQNSRAIMHISVGQYYQEGEKLEASIKLINNTFSECDIVLCDSLQRHTLGVFDDSDKRAIHKKSVQAGDDWLERNKEILSHLTIPYEITRWDEWLNHPEYLENHDRVKKMYADHIDYQRAVNNTINKFLDRYKSRVDVDQTKYQEVFENSLTYLLEECAIIIPIWIKLGYEFVIYPRKRTEAMEMTYQLLGKPYYPDLMKEVFFKFTRRSLLSPFNK